MTIIRSSIKSIVTITLSSLSFIYTSANVAHGHETMNDNITIEHAWSRATAPGAPTGASYATITNKTDNDITLTSVNSDVAEKIEMHGMKMEGDLMKMFTLEEPLVIPANSSLDIVPNGIHVMLIGLNKPLVVDEHFDMTFNFSNGDSLTTQVNIYKSEEHSMKSHKGMSHSH
jgi:Uncharacterized protein conserved in bacteria